MGKLTHYNFTNYKAVITINSLNVPTYTVVAYKYILRVSVSTYEIIYGVRFYAKSTPPKSKFISYNNNNTNSKTTAVFPPVLNKTNILFTCDKRKTKTDHETPKTTEYPCDKPKTAPEYPCDNTKTAPEYPSVESDPLLVFTSKTNSECGKTTSGTDNSFSRQGGSGETELAFNPTHKTTDVDWGDSFRDGVSVNLNTKANANTNTNASHTTYHEPLVDLHSTTSTHGSLVVWGSTSTHSSLVVWDSTSTHSSLVVWDPAVLNDVKTPPSVGSLECNPNHFHHEAEIEFRRKHISSLIQHIEQYFVELELVKVKGYVNSFDLTNHIKYPTLSNTIDSIIDHESHKFKSVDDLIKYLTEHRVRELIDLVSISSNIILLKLYTKTSAVLSDKREWEDDDDLFNDLEELHRTIYSKMHPTIRLSLQKKGLIITQNIYTGFDTEYQRVDTEINKLLSVQMAINTKTMLKLPKRVPYKLGSVNTLTGEFYKGKRFKHINIENVEDTIEELIKGVRCIKYPLYDQLIDFIIKRLTLLEYPPTLMEGFIEFNLPRTPIHQWIKITNDFSFKQLVRTSNKIAEADLEESLVRVRDVFNQFKGFEINDDDPQRPANSKTEILETHPPDFRFNCDLSDDKLHLNNCISDVKNHSDVLEKIKSSLMELDLKDNDLDLIHDDSGVIKSRGSRNYTRRIDKFMVSCGVSITKVKNNFFIAHLTAADLSILKDFNEFKDDIDIVNKCMVTLKKPLSFDGVNVLIRDTMLLAPGGSKSLASIGNLYGDTFKKIVIDKSWYSNMELFMKERFNDFKEYALRDALIALIHGLYMEEFNNCLGRNTIPLTLAGLSTSFIRKHWKETGYEGYQLHPEHMLSNPNQLQTPKGLHKTGSTGLHIPLYLANYKAGRNESFMYGYDDTTLWFDYDLTSAYTTVMSLLGDPDYGSGKTIKGEDVKAMSVHDLIESYTVVSCSFEFKDSIKYPSIPCFVGKDVIVYPLKGKAVITGLEYLVAINQGCRITINEGYSIPFKKELKLDVDGLIVKDDKGLPIKETIKPFKGIIHEVQRLRGKYPKHSINNLLYKEIGNSGYGLTTRGISDKKLYDNRIKETRRVDGNDLSNPIIASWITAFVRSLIGETLHNTHLLGGRIVSVTTDGFISDLDNLENRFIENPSLKTPLWDAFRLSRIDLSGDSLCFELKSQSRGVLSWTTRGQLGLDGGKIIATTGLQRKNLDRDSLTSTLINTFYDEDRELSFTQETLRSSSSIMKKGGMVTNIYADRTFRMGFDNRRLIINPDNMAPTKVLLDSKPLQSADLALIFRHLMRLSFSNQFQRTASASGYRSTYKDLTELAVRKFIRSLFNNDYNLKADSFKTYLEIVAFIKLYNPCYPINTNNIANLKRRRVNKQKIVRTPETEKFCYFVRDRFNDFDVDAFLDN